MNKEIIRLENITKSYSKQPLLKHIDLVVNKGSSIALTGNNGSGKSTLLKIISGLTDVNSGKIHRSNNLKFNYIPEHFPKLNISAKQYIEAMGRIEKVPLNELMHTAEELFRGFHLENMLNIQMRYLSKGSLQKVAVIQALLTTPDVLLLDEPLSGQDIDSQKYFIQLVNHLKLQGVAIVMSCHEMFLVNQVSDIAYKIVDHQLVQVDIDHLSNMEYDILCFDHSQNLEVPERIRSDIAKIENADQVIKILVTRTKSNMVLREMLKEGYQLRSMRGVEQ